jgi:hypothetical protein
VVALCDYCGAMFGFVHGWVEFSARTMLARLHERIGGPGMAAAVAIPGLAAMIDQHAAAVRDILAAGVEGSATATGVVLLAGYARGLLDHAREMGWHVGEPATGWDQTDWLTTRLLAICDLARRADKPSPVASEPLF